MKRYYIAITFLLVVGMVVAISHFLVSRGAVSDVLRVEDISKIESAVQKYAADNEKLPNSLKNLQPDKTLKYHDYTYQKDSESEFSICATFKTKANSDDYGDDNIPSSHKAGYQCFKKTAYSLKPATFSQ